ncbi:hypothetical protein [Galbibacter sp. BG1]
MPLEAQPGVGLGHNSELSATPENYQSLFDYSNQNDPDTFIKLFPQYGSGLITGFIKLFGAEIPFSSDQVIHTEEGRLHQIVKDATFATDVFTTSGGEKHNLRVGDTIVISDGTDLFHADVSEIVSGTEFKAANRLGTGFTFAGPVDLFAYSSDFPKKTTGFNQGRHFKPEVYKNHPQIIKEFYDIAESDLAQKTWVQTQQGKDVWFTYELERTRKLMLNKQEMTHLFGEQAAAGSDAEAIGKKGMKGVVPTVKGRGNVMNGYISTLGDLNDLTKRLRRQGECTTFTIWADQQQQIEFNSLLAGLNAHYTTGLNYGMFNNSKDMAAYLDFKDVYVNGMSFFLTGSKVLDDPTLFGADKFLTSSIGGLIVPAGEKQVTENGEKVSRPYIAVRYRKSPSVDRYMRTKIFGMGGTPIRKDAMEVEYITEQTNQVVGPREFGVINR